MRKMYCPYCGQPVDEGCRCEEYAAEDKRMWYAVQKTREDAWDYGSEDYSRAVQMLKEQGFGLIAVIDGDVCVEEVEIDEA